MTRSILAAAFASCLLAGSATAETLQFHTAMSAETEVPPKQSAGTGTVDATLDSATKVLSYTATWQGLSGPATMGHFHGPAAAGANAGVVVPWGKDIASPLKATATLTDAQVADLEAGKWYANVHTAANPAGEIRGQVTPAK